MREALNNRPYPNSAEWCNNSRVVAKFAKEKASAVSGKKLVYKKFSYVEHFSSEKYHHFHIKISDLSADGVVLPRDRFAWRIALDDWRRRFYLTFNHNSGLSTLTSFALQRKSGSYLELGGNDSKAMTLAKLSKLSKEDLLIIKTIIVDSPDLIANLIGRKEVDESTREFWQKNMQNLKEQAELFELELLR